MPRTKKKTSKKQPTPSTASAKGSTAHRLSDDQKQAIAAAGPDVTNTALAAQFGTSMQTVAKYRTATPSKKGRGGSGAGKNNETHRGPGGIEIHQTAEFVTIKIPKKHLLRDVLADLLK